MKAAFAFRASVTIGGGHAVRCLTLADGLARMGWSCVLLADGDTLAAVPMLARSGHALADTLDGPADLLVVDDYARHRGNPHPAAVLARRVLVIDDLADRAHDCDLLLDTTLGRDPADYRDLVPQDCPILAGSAYALLRPEFQSLRSASLDRRREGRLERVLVTMGATDPEGATLGVLDALDRALPGAAVDVVFGSACPHLAAVRARVSALGGRATLHVDTDRMAGLMAVADLAVGAAGTTSWERCCLGLPTLVVTTADNQIEVSRALAASGAAELVGRWGVVGAESMAARLSCLTADRLKEMSHRAAALVDGRGVQRVILALAGALPARDGRPVTLRLAQPSDAMTILEWQRLPETRRFAVNPAVPDEADHLRWMDGKLSDPACLLTIIEHDDVPAGVVRLDREDGAPPRQIVSIFVVPGHHRLGIGNAALSLAALAAPGSELIARVLNDNVASSALFKGAGYSKEPDGLFHLHPAKSP